MTDCGVPFQCRKCTSDALRCQEKNAIMLHESTNAHFETSVHFWLKIDKFIILRTVLTKKNL